MMSRSQIEWKLRIHDDVERETSYHGKQNWQLKWSQNLKATNKNQSCQSRQKDDHKDRMDDY